MKIEESIQTHKTSDPRDIYKALGKGHLYEYQMRESAIAAANWRRITDTKGRAPGGVGEPHMALPEIIVDHYREGRMEEYQTDRKKFWCWLWHRFPDHRSTSRKRCLCCGRA